MVALVYITVIILYINIYAITPILLLLIRDIGIDHFKAGLLMAVYTIVFCVSNIFTGMLSDRFGPEKIMMMGLLITFLSSLVFTYTSNFNTMLALRALIGIGAAAMSSPCIIYLLSWLPPENKSLGSSGYFASVTLGEGIVFLITPVSLNIYSWRLLLRFYAVLVLIALTFLFIFSKNATKKIVTNDPLDNHKAQQNNILNPAIILLSIILFITLFQIGGTLTWFAPWLEEKCMFHPLEVGLGSMTFALVGVPSSIFGGYVFGKYMRSNIKRAISLSMVGMLISASTMAFVWLENTKYFLLILALAILARWGSFMSFGPLISIAPKLTEASSREGFIIGFITSIAMSGGFLGSLLGGMIIEWTGQYHLIWIVFSLSLIFSAFVLHPLFNKKILRIYSEEVL